MTVTDPNIRDNTQGAVEGEQSSIVPQGTNNSEGNSQSTGGNTSPTVTTNTQPASVTSAISTKVPEELKKVNNYGELYKYLEEGMKANKPLTEEELKKLRRKQKIEGIISGVSDAAQSIANLYFTTQYAPNMYNAKEGMSAKAKERFEKEKAERDAANDKFYNYAMQYAKLKGEDADRGLQIWQTEQGLARQDRNYEASRQDRKDDVDYRNRAFEREGEWHKESTDLAERQFKQSVQQFNTSSSIERKRLELEGKKIAQELKNGSMTFNLGSGNGNVTLSADQLNAQTVSRIYYSLEDKFKYDYVDGTDSDGKPVKKRVPKIQGDPIVKDGIIVGNKEPSLESMLIAIGEFVEQSPSAQKAIKQVAGLEVGELPQAY
jgi:hypothetical protein